MVLRICFIGAFLLLGCGELSFDNPDDPRNAKEASTDDSGTSSSSVGTGNSPGDLRQQSSNSQTVPSGCASSGKGNDIKSYKTVDIGEQTWMAENLNYDVEGSVCNDEEKYGRLYNWATAMALDDNCNSSPCASQVSAKHKGICPSGWHIPINGEWQELMNYIQSENCSVDECLKAKSGWYYDGNGNDMYKFTALPGGYGQSGGGDIGINGFWWSSIEGNSFQIAHDGYAGISGFDKRNLFSVRCVKD